MPPLMDRYGLGMPMGPSAMVCCKDYSIVRTGDSGYICATFYLSFLYMIVYWNLRFSAVMMFSSASSLTVFVIINTEIYFCRASQQVAFQTPPSSGISLAHL
jgi:hypothetical protein